MKGEQIKWEITTTGKKVQLLESHVEIEELYGGFGQGQRILTVPQIAKLHVDDPTDKKQVSRRIERINALINNNLQNFIYNIDIIDLYQQKDCLELLISNKIYTQNSVNKSENLYIISFSGYCKLFNLFRIKNFNTKKEISEKYFNEKDSFVYNVIYKEIEFKNKLERRLNIILENTLKNGWNINTDKLRQLINDKQHLPKHQYCVCNGKYQIDFFWRKLKLIVEFDEERHKYYKEDDKKRMDEIIQYLSLNDGDCGYNENNILTDIFDEVIDSDNSSYTIMRISESDVDAIDKVIGIILGELLSI